MTAPLSDDKPIKQAEIMKTNIDMTQTSAMVKNTFRTDILLSETRNQQLQTQNITLPITPK